MTKSILSFVCIGLCMVVCAEEPAFVGQEIGSIPLQVKKQAMVAVAFNELSANDNQSVSVSNILSTANLASGDQVFVYKNGGFQSWTFNGTGWQENTANFTLDANANQNSAPGAKSDEIRPAIGEGFWLIRAGDPPTPESVTVYIYGHALSSAPQQTAAAGTKTLIGNPLMCDATPTFTSPNKGDRVTLVTQPTDSVAMGMKTYTYNGTTWGYWPVGTAQNPFPDFVPEQVTIPAGVSFWYNSTGGESVTITWPAAQ